MRRLIGSLVGLSRNTLYRRTSFILVVESLGKVFLFATTFVAASVLPSAEFALFGVLLAVQQFVTIVAQGGLVEAVLGKVGKITDADGRSRVYRASFRAFGWSASVAFVAVLVWAGGLSPLPGWRGLAAAVALLSGALMSSAVLLRTNFIMLEGHTTRSCLIKGLLYLSGSSGGLLLLVVERTASSYYWGYLVFVVPVSLYALVLGRGASPKAQDDGALAKGLILRSLPFASTSLLAWASSSGATLVIYRFFDARTTACYTLMTSISGILVFATSSVNLGWQPEMLKSMHGTGHSVEESRRRLAGIMEVALLGCAVVLLLAVALARDRAVWFPAKYPEMEFILPLAFAAILGNLNYFVTVNQYMFYGAGGQFLRISFYGYLLGGALWFALGYRFGEIGVFLGWGMVILVRGAAVSRIAARNWKFLSDPWQTARVMVAFAAFVYLLSFNPQVQALRHLYHM